MRSRAGSVALFFAGVASWSLAINLYAADLRQASGPTTGSLRGASKTPVPVLKAQPVKKKAVTRPRSQVSSTVDIRFEDFPTPTTSPRSKRRESMDPGYDPVPGDQDNTAPGAPRPDMPPSDPGNSQSPLDEDTTTAPGSESPDENRGMDMSGGRRYDSQLMATPTPRPPAPGRQTPVPTSTPSGAFRSYTRSDSQ